MRENSRDFSPLNFLFSPFFCSSKFDSVLQRGRCFSLIIEKAHVAPDVCPHKIGPQAATIRVGSKEESFTTRLRRRWNVSR